VARRGTRSEQYFQIAAYYGFELVENLHDPHVPEFVIVHAARRAAHYALTALSLEAKRVSAAQMPPAPLASAPPRAFLGRS
jgi:hypothetical protein